MPSDWPVPPPGQYPPPSPWGGSDLHGSAGDDALAPEIDGAPRRTNPLTVVVDVLRLATASALLFLQLTGGFAASNSDRGSGGYQVPWALYSMLILAVVVFGLRIAGWYCRTYVVGADAMTIEYGVIARHKRVIPYGRLQQIDVDQSLLMRLFSMCVLTIETAGSAQGKVKLGLLDVRLARGIRRHALARRADIQGTLRDVTVGQPVGETSERQGASAALPPPPPAAGSAMPHGAPLPPPPSSSSWSARPFAAAPEVVLARIDGGRLAVAGLTHHAVVTITPLLMLVGLALGVVIAPTVTGTSALLVVLSALAITAGLAAFMAINVLAIYLIGLYGYTLSEQGDDLHARFGLLDVRNLTIPRWRVQHVTIVDNPLRRMLGIVSITLHSAAATGVEETSGSSSASMLLGASQTQAAFEIPILNRADLDGFLHALMGGDWHVPTLTPRPPAARRRAIVRRVGALALIVVGPAFALPPGSLLLLAVPLLGIPWGLWAHQRAGYAEAPEVLVLARGVFHHRIELVPYTKVQSSFTVQNPMQRLSSLRTLHVNVAGSSADPRLSDMSAEAAIEYARDLPIRAG